VKPSRPVHEEPSVPASAHARFAELVESLRQRPDVTAPGESGARSGFGSSALKVNGKIFAMLVDERLVVKLPKQRVAQLASDGHGVPLDTGQGRRMKEWLSVAPESPLDWLHLSAEALAFVQPQGGASKRA
jgi:TfoX/Sxy family transcriptional regulator of competence genes